MCLCQSTMAVDARMIRCLLIAALFPATLLASERCVVDDHQREVCLEQAAQRIISLSPGVTELLFAAGAGDRLVGTTSFSDYPDQAQALPRIGSYKRIDMEAVLAAEPDLVVAWISGNPTEQVERLESLGVTVYWGEQREFDDIARTLERYGRLAGTEATANVVAGDFRRRIEGFRSQFAEAAPVSVFYQVWDDPLMTVNADHLISKSIALCGGENIFAELPRLTPRIDIESVLAADPEAILAGGMGESDASWLLAWRRFGDMQAVRNEHLFLVPPSSIQRPTPRMLQGIATICEQLQQVREQRSQHGESA